ncbi:MAG TPA: macrolide ABC transporter ATP-binding protein, partial [Bacteroidales bacterium]|nr:macrolide ABC transporter ATP-binding protein [Bacteroidales bacterium]
LIRDIHRSGNTIIVVTHEEDIARHCHRIIRLIDGQVASDETNAEAVRISEEEKVVKD